MQDYTGLNCPISIDCNDTIRLAHGGGGRLTRNLIESVFYPAFANPILDQRHDSAVLDFQGMRLALTTDSYVVSPLFFPGGDIGKLAVCGTVNDLAMCGAEPHSLTAGFILEEGLSMERLRAVVASMRKAADEAGVAIVTGDTKVVDKGKGDGIFISTSGIGLLDPELVIHPKQVKPGDAVIVSGDIGRHGVAILSIREGLSFQRALDSDCAPLNGLVRSLLEKPAEIHCLRDLTRGGLATALNEIAQDAKLGIELNEYTIPVAEPVRGACEMLGLDPLYVANEGRLVAFVSDRAADKFVDILHSHPLGSGAERIGRVTDTHPGSVLLNNNFGSSRILDFLSGEQLPRIC